MEVCRKNKNYDDNCEISNEEYKMNILAARNRKSENLEIVFFVLNYSSISMGIFVKALPHLRCVAAFTNIPVEIMIQYAQKRI